MAMAFVAMACIAMAYVVMANRTLCGDERRRCLRARSAVSEEAGRLVNDLAALEMRRKLPGEVPFKLPSAALDLVTSKVAAAELAKKSFGDSATASFRLPTAVLGKTNCRTRVNSTRCGVNIQAHMIYVVMAYVLMADIAMAYVVMAYVVMNYVVMAYIVMALYSYI